MKYKTDKSLKSKAFYASHYLTGQVIILPHPITFKIAIV